MYKSKRNIGQLLLKLDISQETGLENFFISKSNELAVKFVQRWKSWTNRRLLLTGPAASGKSHLARHWVEESGAVVILGKELVDKDIVQLGRYPAVLLENIDEALVAAQGISTTRIEESVFHLLNSLSSADKYLLITGCHPVSQWNTKSADLISRLMSMEAVQLLPPDDELLMAVLVKQFGDKQIMVSPKVIFFIVKRIDRSFEAIRTFVNLIDELTLREKRDVTIPVASDVLEIMYDRPRT